MAKEFTIEQERLDELLAEVTTEISAMLRKDEVALSKGLPPSNPDESSEGSEGPAAPPEGEASAPEPEMSGAPDASAPPVAEGTPEGSPEMPPEGSAPEAPGQGEIEPAPTVEQLQQEYAQLDPETLKMHYLAAKTALMAMMGQEQSAGAPPAEAPPAPMAPPAGPPEASAPPALKSELKGKVMPHNPSNGGKMGKSEKDVEIELLKEQLKKTEESVMQLAEIVARPLRKSVRGISELKFLNKEGETPVAAAVLTKSQITDKLREVARTALAKSDRELINQYSVGSIDVSKIQHLLK